MRVCFLAHSIQWDSGGGATFEDSVLQALSKIDIGHDCYFMCLDGNCDDHYTLKQISWNRKKSWINRIFPKAICINKLLIEEYNIDFVWAITPSAIRSGLKLPYALTVWDLSHRGVAMFPEFMTSGWPYTDRERHYQEFLMQASVVITGNEVGKREIQRFYAIPDQRIKVIPFSVPPFVFESYPTIDANKQWNIQHPFLFYPAQFWPHKNHVCILKALKKLMDSGHFFSVVFCGADKGNLSYIKQCAKSLGVDEYVQFLGFVSRAELVSLYQQAFAMVYASYLGPNNLPPLESMALQCPVICSNIAGMQEQLSDAALFFDPNSDDQLVDAVVSLMNGASVRQTCIENGNRLVASLSIESYVKRIKDVLDEIEPMRSCWSNQQVWNHL